jgi:chorismate mutase
MWCRGVRGATTADANTSEEILKATRQLLALIIRKNGVRKEDVTSATFSTSPDLNAEFPAMAARQLGWLDVAMMCTHEMDVANSLPLCIRVLIHWNTDKRADEIVHVYLKQAAILRPDLSKLPPVDWAELESWIAEHSDMAIKSSRK